MQETAEQKTGGKRQQNRRLVMLDATEQKAGHVGDIRTEDRSCKVQQNRRQVMLVQIRKQVMQTTATQKTGHAGTAENKTGHARDNGDINT